MNVLILTAIVERRRLSFTYHDRLRIVEPQCYGVGTRGTELLRAFQRQGGSLTEPLFDVEKMVDLTLLPEHFGRPGPHYRRDDSAMTTIFGQL